MLVLVLDVEINVVCITFVYANRYLVLVLVSICKSIFGVGVSVYSETDI